jgi:hypothetical protein
VVVNVHNGYTKKVAGKVGWPVNWCPTLVAAQLRKSNTPPCKSPYKILISFVYYVAVYDSCVLSDNYPRMDMNDDHIEAICSYSEFGLMKHNLNAQLAPRSDYPQSH